MPEKLLCHKFAKNTLSKFHKARMDSLLLSAEGLICSNQLTLTSIGRHLSGKANVKHKIKRVDRLLNNSHLIQEQVDIYQALAAPLINDLPILPIAVDWSGCCGSDYHLLRASLTVEGRSVVIYNMIVEQQDLDTPKTNGLFMDNLYKILGDKKPVYIISDGGFLTPWYTKVLSLGWHFIGRLRGTMKCQLEAKSEGVTLEQLHTNASSKPNGLGKARLAKHSATACDAWLHLYKGEEKGRTGKSRFTKDDKMYRNLANEPWLIATSDDTLSSQQVIKFYSQRMQIEQNFRDDKSQRYGFSWRHSKTEGVSRMSVLCLIACIASSLLWFIGFEAERRKWHKKYQANTVKDRRVLSFLSLAKCVIYHVKRKLTKAFFSSSLKYFKLYMGVLGT